MVEPVSITIAAIGLIGTIVVAVIQLFKTGWNCSEIHSDCCTIETETTVIGRDKAGTINHNERNI